MPLILGENTPEFHQCCVPGLLLDLQIRGDMVKVDVAKQQLHCFEGVALRQETRCKRPPRGVAGVAAAEASSPVEAGYVVLEAIRGLIVHRLSILVDPPLDGQLVSGSFVGQDKWNIGHQSSPLALVERRGLAMLPPAGDVSLDGRDGLRVAQVDAPGLRPLCDRRSETHLLPKPAGRQQHVGHLELSDF